ncbi:hypothetical protein RHGRI_003408 [Rhododendron griersonianum]|uniref:glucose-1-phosphate adenylyltransferase n=1 Tax=Rhododendron griersonianum TaxID=479676 RepID=A0AAV6L624_9ERIC|nr:hypothetical protein RHGRI_003408 [Rhododendron griersonianum]
MAVSTDCRIALSAAGKLSGTTGLSGRDWRLLKFCNGELMGKQLKWQGSLNMGIKKGSVRTIVCTSLTANVAAAGEAKLRDLEMEKKDPRTVVAIILGGGAGTRLFPLTKRRAKPAVPIGGSYRLIDVPMSNCINSGINKVYILTQFNSASLNRHIARAYNLGGGASFGDGYVEDARSKDIDDVLILSGDHLYRMNYMDLVQNHRHSGADITISSLPMDDSRASDFGLMKIDSKGRIMSFSEKPKGKDLKAMAVDTTVLGLKREEAEKKPYIASMGVYVFKKEILLNILRWRFPTANDFGSEIIPASAKEYFIKVGNKSFPTGLFWLICSMITGKILEQLDPFLKQTLLLLLIPQNLASIMQLSQCTRQEEIYPRQRLTIARSIVDSIVSHGSFLTNCFIEHSVVGIRSRINSNVHLKDTVMLGADNYETDAEIASLLAEGRVPIGIGENTKIKDCIIDKNARIGRNVVIANSEGIQEADRSSEGFYIRSGITVILKNSTILDGLVI